MSKDSEQIEVAVAAEGNGERRRKKKKQIGSINVSFRMNALVFPSEDRLEFG